MGRDWYWGSKSTTTTTKKVDITETPGCMTGVLHLFDFHQFQFPITQSPCFKPNSILQEDPTSIKGVEAPRNSLESYEGMTMAKPSSSKSREQKEENCGIPVEIRVLAKNAMGNEGVVKTCSSDSSSSPGPKTPSLVARLMGLDLLPDTLSSSASSSPASVRLNKLHQQSERREIKHKKRSDSTLLENEGRGSRSLPDTPRISSARRSDADPRLSLQVYKENMMNNEELDYFSRISGDQREVRNDQEENRSPGYYARQIVKQVKETVSRRVGLLDITNTANNKNNSSSRAKSKEVEVIILKSKKPKRLTKIGEESNSNKRSTLSNSMAVDQVAISPTPLSKPRPRLPVEGNVLKSEPLNKPKSKLQPLQQHPTMEKCKKASCERFTQRKEASKPHLNQQCNKNNQLPKEIITEYFPSTSSSSHHHHHQNQVSRLSSCSSRTWWVTPSLDDRDNHPTSFSDEIRYVSEILKSTGVQKDSIISFTRWFSPIHPLDPSIFHRLENYTLVAIGPLKHRCNRRLIFNLVDEILANVIKPYLNMKPWLTRNEEKVCPRDMRGDRLLQCLCVEIKKYRSSNCETLQDIDNLIEKDLIPGAKMRTLALFEESESIVFEIEKDILDSLVHETAADVIQKRRHNSWSFT